MNHNITIQDRINHYQLTLEEMDDEELFSETDLDGMREERIEEILEGDREELEKEDNEELFGAERWAYYRKEQIEERLEKFRKELGEQQL